MSELDDIAAAKAYEAARHAPDDPAVKRSSPHCAAISSNSTTH